MLDWQFETPGASSFFYLLGVLFVLFVVAEVLRRRTGRRLGHKRNLVPRSQLISAVKGALFLAAFSLITLALMQPKTEGHYLSTPQKEQHNILFLIDTSLSMNATDTPSKRSRLDQAKEIADQITSHLNGENASLYTFTASTEQKVPWTMDTLYLRLKIRELSAMLGSNPGTDLLQALEKAHSAFPSGANNSLILLTDGEDPQNKDPKYVQKLLQAVKSAPPMTLYTIGIGTEDGQVLQGIFSKGLPVHTSLEAAPLKAISSETGGLYLASDATSSLRIGERVARSIKSTSLSFSKEQLVYQEAFQWPVFIAICLFLFVLHFPDVPLSRVVWMGLFFLPWSLGASLDQALLNYAAGNEKKALSQFEELLEEEPHSSKRDVLLFDIGTTELKEKRPQEALDAFFQIRTNKKIPPYFLYPYHFNLAKTYALLADHATSDVMQSFFTQLSEQESRTAKQVFCAWKQIPCPEMPSEAPSIRGSVSKEELFYLYRATLHLYPLTVPILTSLDALGGTIDLSPAIEALSTGDEEKAREELKKAFVILADDLPAASTPQDALKRMIDLQESLSPLPISMKMMTTFEEKAQNQQEQQFAEGMCLCQPWVEVFPLFDQGVHLSQGDTLSQAEAIALWQQALHLLKSPLKEPLQAPALETLHELEAMDAKDRVRIETTPPPTGEVPW